MEGVFLGHIYSKESKKKKDYKKLYKLNNFFFIFLIKKHWNYTMKGVLLGHGHLHAYIDRKYVLYSEDIIIFNKKSKCIYIICTVASKV